MVNIRRRRYSDSGASGSGGGSTSSSSGSLGEPTKHKIVILGDGGVGKSCMVLRLVDGTFTDDYDPTIEDSYIKMAIVDGKPCTLDVLDTAGQEQYISNRETYFRHGEGFILVFALNDMESFEKIVELREQIIRVKDSENIPILLVANKCDIQDRRMVPAESIRKRAEEWNTPFIECSAKIPRNVDAAFYSLVQNIRKTNKQMIAAANQQDKSCCSLG